MAGIMCFGFGVLFLVLTLTTVTPAERERFHKINGKRASVPPMGECSCGAFSTENPEVGAEPLLNWTAMSVPCNANVTEACSNLCVTLSAAIGAKAPKIMCTQLGNASELKVALFFKACKQPWKYSGLRSEHALCCENSLEKICPSRVQHRI